MITARVRHRVEQLTPIVPPNPVADKLFCVSQLLLVFIIILALARICESLEVKEDKTCFKRSRNKRRVSRKNKPVFVLSKDYPKDKKDVEDKDDEKEQRDDVNEEKKPKPKQKSKKKVKEKGEKLQEEEEDDNSNQWLEVKREKIHKKKDDKSKVAIADKNRKTPKNERNARTKSAKNGNKTDYVHKNRTWKDKSQPKNGGKSRGQKTASKDKALAVKTHKDWVTKPTTSEKKRKGKGKSAVKEVKQQQPAMFRSYAAVLKAGLH